MVVDVGLATKETAFCASVSHVLFSLYSVQWFLSIVNVDVVNHSVGVLKEIYVDCSIEERFYNHFLDIVSVACKIKKKTLFPLRFG